MKENQGLKLWEKALVAFAAMLFLASAWLYFSDISLRGYLFGISTERGTQAIGKVAEENGQVRRKLIASAAFDSLPPDGILYDSDTVVTGPDATAHLKIGDDSFIDLGPSTMVRLEFENKVSLEGVSHAPTISVLSGNVSGNSSAKNVVLKSGGKSVRLTREKQQITAVAPPPVIKRLVLPAEVQPSPRPIAPIPKIPTPSPTPTPTPSPSPSPKPSPTPSVKPTPRASLIQLIYPPQRAHLKVVDGSETASVPVKFHWKVNLAPARTMLILKHLAANGKTLDEVSREFLSSKTGDFMVQKELTAAGQYFWLVQGEDGKSIGKDIAKGQSTFTVDPEFVGIEALTPLIGGKEITSSDYTGTTLRDFDVTVRWKQFDKADTYTVSLLKSATATQAFVEKVAKGTTLVFKGAKVYSGQTFVLISTRLEGGFLARSKPRPLLFNFVAPALVSPANATQLDATRPSGGSVLLTWRKTNFTDNYEVEIATDSHFTKMVKKAQTRENLLLISLPQAGLYWWRVRSIGKGMVSPFSEPFSFRLPKAIEMAPPIGSTKRAYPYLSLYRLPGPCLRGRA